MTLAACHPGDCSQTFGIVKNFDSDRWSAEEIGIVKSSPSQREAIDRYREKYPDSLRSDDAILRHYYDLRPDMRKRVPLWTAEEKAPIQTTDTIDEALSEYRRLFPNSTRSDPAIRREWFALRPEKRGIVHCGRKKGGTNKLPLKGSYREQYRIPFRTTNDPKGYNNAVNLCKRYNKPYDEAVQLRDGDIAERARRKAEKLQKFAARKALIKKVRTEKKPPKRKGKSATVPKITENPPAVPEPPKSLSGFAAGQRVIHNGSKSSPYFGKVGRITKIVRSGNSEHLMISYGKGGDILISDKFVTPAGGST